MPAVNLSLGTGVRYTAGCTETQLGSTGGRMCREQLRYCVIVPQPFSFSLQGDSFGKPTNSFTRGSWGKILGMGGLSPLGFLQTVGKPRLCLIPLLMD